MRRKCHFDDLNLVNDEIFFSTVLSKVVSDWQIEYNLN